MVNFEKVARALCNSTGLQLNLDARYKNSNGPLRLIIMGPDRGR